MGLDIYVGTLTRYYSGNWKTITQQWAEANGMNFQRMTPNTNEEAPPDPEEVRKVVSQWRDNLLRGISPPEGPVYPAWEENNNAAYYTDKPDWIAFGALLLYGACRRYGLKVPATVPKSWDYNKNEIIRRAYEDQELNWSLYTGAEWWIPISDGFAFRYQTPTGKEIGIATAGTLLAELDKINQTGWQADGEAVLEWSRTQGYPPDGTIVDGKYQPGTPHTEYDTQSLAKFAFSILHQAARFSLDNGTVIIMDY